MQRDLVLQEKTAWREYRRYCLFRRTGNRGPNHQGVFLGDERSHDLWRIWVALRRQVRPARKRRP